MRNFKKKYLIFTIFRNPARLQKCFLPDFCTLRGFFCTPDRSSRLRRAQKLHEKII
jgi:hypothetical protein